MANTKARNAPVPPEAPVRPRELSAHGATWRDDYAWMRAENWREVLRDPAALPAEIRDGSRPKTPMPKRFSAPTRALQRQLVREMRARLKEDDSEPAAAGRPLQLLFALPPWGPASHPLPAPARRRQRDGADRRRRASAGQGVLPSRRRPPFARPSQIRLELRRQGLGNARHPGARRRGRGRSHRSAGEHDRGNRLDAKFAGVSLHPAGREPSALARDAASARRAAIRGSSASSRKPIPPGSCRSRRPASDGAPSSWCTATTPRRRMSSISASPADPPRRIAPRRPGLVIIRWITATSSTSGPTPAAPTISRS